MESEKVSIGIPKESRLKSMLTTPKPRAPIITVFGEGGVGKTSLFSLFPSPVLIRTEDGSQSIDGKKVYMFDLASSYDDVINQLDILLQDDHKFKTVGIDSITKMHSILEAEVLASDPKAQSLNQALGGYGAGNKAIAKKHAEIRRLCGLLNSLKGMTVVFIAHAELNSVEPPDSQSYTKYSIRIQEKSISHYTDDVDMVAHVKLKTFTKKNEEKVVQAVSTGDIVISCHATASSIAKNRYDITEEIDFKKSCLSDGLNPLAQYIPFYNIKE